MEQSLGLRSNQRNIVTSMVAKGLDEPHVMHNTLRNKLVADSLQAKGICTVVTSKTKLLLYPQKEHYVFEVLSR